MGHRSATCHYLCVAQFKTPARLAGLPTAANNSSRKVNCQGYLATHLHQLMCDASSPVCWCHRHVSNHGKRCTRLTVCCCCDGCCRLHKGHVHHTHSPLQDIAKHAVLLVTNKGTSLSKCDAREPWLPQATHTPALQLPPNGGQQLCS